MCEQYTLYELVKGLCWKCECRFVGRTVSQLKKVLYIEVMFIIYIIYDQICENSTCGEVINYHSRLPPLSDSDHSASQCALAPVQQPVLLALTSIPN